MVAVIHIELLNRLELAIEKFEAFKHESVVTENVLAAEIASEASAELRQLTQKFEILIQ